MRRIERFLGWTSDLGTEFFARLDRNFQSVAESDVVQNLVDASAGTVLIYLPVQPTLSQKKYLYIKSDPSANHVEIIPTSPDTIFGTYTEFELTMQGAFVYITWNAGIWYPISYG